ncbi:S-adenosyl-L-methionine-dependent methyltransferase [Fimicolochytrium jonesii]|uniref:S-adenosyl-L-methionine-dependent methyltransferase n=1 Tax=Fimicolochytrium jonesii TaxID=1396493 RepID=UPI0022FEC281|nr:S-adenosyl-L-methionine-dependent methyltransferase [Fimicolochytrium jonesii]KAI8815515.1 S-adenosyl-L-methionine-dependent methyltransferase [Fimicolochytrium jonesii]
MTLNKYLRAPHRQQLLHPALSQKVFIAQRRLVNVGPSSRNASIVALRTDSGNATLDDSALGTSEFRPVFAILEAARAARFSTKAETTPQITTSSIETLRPAVMNRSLMPFQQDLQSGKVSDPQSNNTPSSSDGVSDASNQPYPFLTYSESVAVRGLAERATRKLVRQAQKRTKTQKPGDHSEVAVLPVKVEDKRVDAAFQIGDVLHLVRFQMKARPEHIRWMDISRDLSKVVKHVEKISSTPSWKRTQASIVCFGILSHSDSNYYPPELIGDCQIKSIPEFLKLLGWHEGDLVTFKNSMDDAIKAVMPPKEVHSTVGLPQAQSVSKEMSKKRGETRLRPMFTWQGGKSDELPILQKYIPKTMKTYVEPFAGGLAMYFFLRPKQSVVADTHHELINFYRQIQLGNRVEILRRLRDYKFTEDEYYSVRDAQNGDEIDRAVRFFYLRCTCYRGMLKYRKSNTGNLQSTVSFGTRAAGKVILSRFEDERYEKLLSTTMLMNESFENLFCRYNDPEDFFFLDPPYDSPFNDYSNAPFGRVEHQRLADCFRTTKARCLMVLGNTPFIFDLYRDYIKAAFPKPYRFKIGGQPRGPDMVAEHLIIANYD